MNQPQQFPASQSEPAEAPPTDFRRRACARSSAAVQEYITRMVAGMNSYKAKE